MANPFPFSSGDVLTAAELNDIGERVAFTPSWVNFTPGNATESWFYVQVNELLFVYGATTLGSTSAFTGGSIRLTIPTGLRSGFFHNAGALQMRDTSPSVNYEGSWRIRSDANDADLQAQDSSGTYLTAAGVGATVPFTWATGDQIRGSFTVALQ